MKGVIYYSNPFSHRSIFRKGAENMKITKKLITAFALVIMLFCAAIPSLPASAAAVSEETETVSMVQITGNPVNIRKGAGTSYGKIASVKKGTQFRYLTAKTVSGVKWYQIQYNSTTKGWVMGKYAKIVNVSSSSTTTSQTAKKVVQITASPVNIRKGAGTSYGKVASVKKGAQFSYLATKTVSGVKWYQIQYNSTTKAWVMGKYAKIVTTGDTTTTTTTTTTTEKKMVQITGSGVNIRKGAGTSYGRVATVKKGTQFSYLATKTVSGVKWYQIQYNSTTKAWVTGKYSKIVTVSAASSTDSVNVIGALAEARVQFPDGKYWNSVGLSSKNTNGVTSQPCPGGHNSATCNGQCAGYTNKIGEKIYKTAASKWTVTAKNTTWAKAKDSIRIGDVIRYNNKHSVMVTAIDGDDIYVTDCNWNYHCRISWDRLFNTGKYITTINYIYRHADNDFKTSDSTRYLEGNFSDAAGKVMIVNPDTRYSISADAEKYDYDIDYYHYNTYKNTVNAYASPDENSKVVAKPLDGEIYYCYGEKMEQKQLYYLVRFNSTYGWVSAGDAIFTKIGDDFVYGDERDETSSSAPWATEETMNIIYGNLITYANESRLEVHTETVSFERTVTKQFKANSYASEAEFTESLMSTFDSFADPSSGFGKVCFYMENTGNKNFEINLFFG